MKVLGALALLCSLALGACGSATQRSDGGATPSSEPAVESPSEPVDATAAATEATATSTEAPTASREADACVQAIATAAAIDDDRDQVTDLDAAIVACPS